MGSQKIFAAESGMSGIFSLVGENYRDSWYEPKKQDKNGNKIKDITGAEITVTDLKEAVRQCRECLASPYLMPSGHTVGENHAYMLRQTARPAKAETGTRQATAVKIRREKNSDGCYRPIFLFPVNDRRMVAQLPCSYARYVRQCHGEKFQRLNPTRHACICTS